MGCVNYALLSINFSLIYTIKNIAAMQSIEGVLHGDGYQKRALL